MKKKNNKLNNKRDLIIFMFHSQFETKNNI